VDESAFGEGLEGWPPERLRSALTAGRIDYVGWQLEAIEAEMRRRDLEPPPPPPPPPLVEGGPDEGLGSAAAAEGSAWPAFLGAGIAAVGGAFALGEDSLGLSLVWATLALVNACLAQVQGRPGASWFLGSVLTGPVATLLLALLGPRGRAAAPGRTVTVSAGRCPYCHECQPHPSSRRRTWS